MREIHQKHWAPKTSTIQKIIGEFYYYDLAVDHMMLEVLGGLVTKQTVGAATTKAVEDIVIFLNYAVTHPNATIKYHTSGMILHLDSGASYLLVSRVWSRVGDHHYLSSPSSDHTKPPVNNPRPNRPLHRVCSMIKNVVSSVAEVEMGRSFVNGQMQSF